MSGFHNPQSTSSGSTIAARIRHLGGTASNTLYLLEPAKTKNHIGQNVYCLITSYCAKNLVCSFIFIYQKVIVLNVK